MHLVPPTVSYVPYFVSFLPAISCKKHWDPLSAHLTLRMPPQPHWSTNSEGSHNYLTPDGLKLFMLGHRILHSQFALGLANNVVDAIRVFVTHNFCSQTSPPP